MKATSHGYIITSAGRSKKQKAAYDASMARQRRLGEIFRIALARGRDRETAYKVAKRFVAIYGVGQ